MRNATAQYMILYAYDLSPAQLANGPGWIETERFDITAKNAEDPPGPDADDRARRRMRRLLEERFGLRLGTEQREIPVFVLTAGAGASKLKPTVNGRGTINVNRNNGNGVMQGDGLATKRLAEALRFVGRPVIDETGLEGLFDFNLTWSDRPDGQDPSIFTALQEQLGLRLEAAKRTLPVSVVDAIVRPSDN